MYILLQSSISNPSVASAHETSIRCKFRWRPASWCFENDPACRSATHSQSTTPRCRLQDSPVPLASHKAPVPTRKAFNSSAGKPTSHVAHFCRVAMSRSCCTSTMLPKARKRAHRHVWMYTSSAILNRCWQESCCWKKAVMGR